MGDHSLETPALATEQPLLDIVGIVELLNGTRQRIGEGRLFVRHNVARDVMHELDKRGIAPLTYAKPRGGL